VYNHPPGWKLVVARMGCTGWMVVQGFALSVGIFLAHWRVDKWEIILEFFGEVLGLFLVYCLFYYYIDHIDTQRVLLRVHDVGINC